MKKIFFIFLCYYPRDYILQEQNKDRKNRYVGLMELFCTECVRKTQQRRSNTSKYNDEQIMPPESTMVVPSMDFCPRSVLKMADRIYNDLHEKEIKKYEKLTATENTNVYQGDFLTSIIKALKENNISLRDVFAYYMEKINSKKKTKKTDSEEDKEKNDYFKFNIGIEKNEEIECHETFTTHEMQPEFCAAIEKLQEDIQSVFLDFFQKNLPKKTADHQQEVINCVKNAFSDIINSYQNEYHDSKELLVSGILDDWTFNRKLFSCLQDNLKSLINQSILTSEDFFNLKIALFSSKVMDQQLLNCLFSRRSTEFIEEFFYAFLLKKHVVSKDDPCTSFFSKSKYEKIILENLEKVRNKDISLEEGLKNCINGFCPELMEMEKKSCSLLLDIMKDSGIIAQVAFSQGICAKIRFQQLLSDLLSLENTENMTWWQKLKNISSRNLINIFLQEQSIIDFDFRDNTISVIGDSGYGVSQKRINPLILGTLRHYIRCFDLWVKNFKNYKQKKTMLVNINKPIGSIYQFLKNIKSDIKSNATVYRRLFILGQVGIDIAEKILLTLAKKDNSKGTIEEYYTSLEVAFDVIQECITEYKEKLLEMFPGNEDNNQDLISTLIKAMESSKELIKLLETVIPREELVRDVQKLVLWKVYEEKLHENFCSKWICWNLINGVINIATSLFY